MRGTLALAAVLALFGCKDDPADDSVPVELGPTLTHTPPEGPFFLGDEIPLEVSAEDEDGVVGVTVYYRTTGQPYWSSADLSGEDAAWSVSLAADELSTPSVEYYFKATDGGESVSYLPTDLTSEAPFSVPVLVRGQTLPWFEDFEVGEGQNDIYDLGWAASADAFQGYLWGLTASESWSGEVAVTHLRGSSSAGQLDDWLITPALDFSGNDRVQVSWYELGGNVEFAQHRLYVSTGSRQPDDGEYVEVQALPAPAEGAWGRSRAIDLSAWAGEPTVYLAWRYTGTAADDWTIDDVSVRALTLDLESAFSVAPEPVHPGERATLTLRLDNLADASASSLSATALVPEGAGALVESTVDLGAMAAFGEADAVFELDIDPSWPDNSAMPLRFDVSDGTDTWTFEHTLIVGQTSWARLELMLDQSGVVQVSLGQGDPENPAWEEDFWGVNASAGLLSLEADITDYHASLPPAVGAERWFARISSTAGGQVEAFELDFGGVTYAASSPPVLDTAADTLVYVPEPAAPVIVSATSTPSTLTPGVAGVSLALLLRNDGADAAGPLSVSLATNDPDVTLIDAGPIELASFPAGTGAMLSSAFSFDVSPAHVDSSSLAFTLELSDGADSWSLPFELEVPWPVLQVTGVEVDDRTGGDNDGVLDAGESATLTLEVSNVGALDAFGIVSGWLELAPSSTAVATVSPDTQTFGQIGAGDSRDDDFDVVVEPSSSAGDTLDLVLHLDDGTTTYEAPVQLVLGERPWILVSVGGDPAGDHNGYTFDIANVRYRCDGTTFELEMEAHAPFDSSTAFVEMWAVPTSAAYYYFRLVLQSGAARLQGYSGGFVALTDPTVSFPDATRVRMSWPVSVMQMNTNTFRAGFGAGWCGAVTGSYCDHFPDNWGYYYSGYSSANFFSFRW